MDIQNRGDHSLLKWLGLVTAAPLVALSGIISLALCQAVISCSLQPASAAAAAAHTKSQYYPGEPLLQTHLPHCPAWLPCQCPAHPHHDTIVIILNRNKELSVNILIRVQSVKVCSVSFPLWIEKSEIVMMNKLDLHLCQAQLNLK